jgi:hypothetical protein
VLKRHFAACLAMGGPPAGTQAQPAAPLRPRVPLPGPARVSLPLPGEGPRLAVPPGPIRHPRLQWPDGRESAGTVHHTPQGPVFEPAAGSDAVLSDRDLNKPGRADGCKPTPLPVALAPGRPGGERYVPRLPGALSADDFDANGGLKVGRDLHRIVDPAAPRVTSVRHMETMSREDLEDLVVVAGGADRGRRRGTSCDHQAVLKHLFVRTLEAMAWQCSDPRAAMNLARAWSGPDSVLHVATPPPGTADGPRQSVQSSFADAEAFRARLYELQAGQHLHVRVLQSNAAGEAHGMGLAFSRLAGDNVRVSIVNPQGWFDPQLERHSAIPGVFKTLSTGEAASAMADLLAGRIPPRRQSVADAAWADTALGHPLLAWLGHAGPAGSALSADFHGTGRSLTSARQKAGDCGIEAMFAFMATALPPADYKLAKAACLNTLVQVADRVAPPGSADPDSPLQVARSRLQDRITSSLGGHMVAPGAARAMPAKPPEGTHLPGPPPLSQLRHPPVGWWGREGRPVP